MPPICEALEYAHEKGVVHRDIKPENLLLDRDGRLKIADFGIASLVGTQGEKAGTPAYMAPEQNGAQVDKRADIYALGVVLYEMLTGERPGKDFVSPSKKVEVDVRIDEMVLRALESEPEKRYQTAGEFRTVVETMTPSSREGESSLDERSSTEGTPLGSSESIQVTRQLRLSAWGLLISALFSPLIPGLSVAAGRLEAGAWMLWPMIYVLIGTAIAAFGALRMMRLESFRSSVAGGISGILISFFNPLCLPFSIWALAVLARREIRAAFASPEKALFQTGGETISHSRENQGSSVTPGGGKLSAFWMASLITYILTNLLWLISGMRGIGGQETLEHRVWFVIAWIVSTVFWSLLHYHCWKALPAKHRATSPGKALGYLFIPFFSIYWAFISFPKLADGVNAWRAEKGGGSVQGLRLFSILYAINFLLYWTVGWNAEIGLVVCVFDLVTFFLFYRLVVRELEREGELGVQTTGEVRAMAKEPLGTPEKSWVRFAATLAFFFGVLSGLIPTLFYWLRPWAAPWLTDEALSKLLEFTAVAAVAAILLGFFSKRLWWGLQGLIMGAVSLVIWLSFFFAGQLSKPTGDGEMAMVGTSRDNYGRVYEARGGSKAMVDGDGDATIFKIDSDLLRFEEDFLQLNGYQVARLPRDVEILIEKKKNQLEVFADGELLLSRSKSASGESILRVSDQFSLALSDSFEAEIKALLVGLEAESNLPKLIDIDDSSVKLFRASEEMFSTEKSLTNFMREKGADFFVEKLDQQWGIVFPKVLPIQLARIPAVDWRQVEPSQVPDYLSNSDFALEGHENGPFMGLYLPFSEGEPVYLAFRTVAGTEGVMAVTESSEVEGLQFQIRYSPLEESDSPNQPLRFVPDDVAQHRSSWMVQPKGSALHPEGWSVMAHLAMNSVARPTWPGDEEPFLLLRLLEGNEDWIKLEIQDLVEERKMTMSLKLGEPGSILVNGKGYRVLFPEQHVAKNKKGTTPFATVLITEENALAEEGEETSLKPEDLEGNLAQFYGTVGNVSISLEEAIITQASKARQGYATLPNPKLKEIPKEYWGEAIARLKPIRVMADRSNVFIVLKEEEGTAHGLYVYNSSSSYFPTLDEARFLELRKMSSSEALWGSIFQCTMKTPVDE